MNEQDSRYFIIRRHGELVKAANRYLAVVDKAEQAAHDLDGDILRIESDECFKQLRECAFGIYKVFSVNIDLTKRNRDLLGAVLEYAALCQRFVIYSDIANLNDPQRFYKKVALTALDELRNAPSFTL